MAENVDVGIGDGPHHPLGHLLAGHAQLAVHTGNDQVEGAEHVVAVVEGAVLEDVDLDPGEDAKRGQPLVEPGDLVHLLGQPLGA